MSLTSAPEPRSTDGQVASDEVTPVRSRARMGRAALVIGIQVVVFAGFWGVFLVHGRGDQQVPVVAASVREAVPVPGGSMTVEDVLPWGTIDHNMAGMQIPDPVPAGKRRVLVDVTLRAIDRPLTYRPAAFNLSGRTMSAIEPWWGTPGVDNVAKGAQTTVTLAFDVPKSATGLQLGLQGSVRRIAIDDGAATPGKGGEVKKRAKAGG